MLANSLPWGLLVAALVLLGWAGWRLAKKRPLPAWVNLAAGFLALLAGVAWAFRRRPGGGPPLPESPKPRTEATPATPQPPKEVKKEADAARAREEIEVGAVAEEIKGEMTKPIPPGDDAAQAVIDQLYKDRLGR